MTSDDDNPEFWSAGEEDLEEHQATTHNHDESTLKLHRCTDLSQDTHNTHTHTHTHKHTHIHTHSHTQHSTSAHFPSPAPSCCQDAFQVECLCNPN